MERVREAAQLAGDGTVTSGDPGMRTPISWPHRPALCSEGTGLCPLRQRLESLAPAEMTNLFAEISFVLRKGITKKIPVTMIIYSFDDAL